VIQWIFLMSFALITANEGNMNASKAIGSATMNTDGSIVLDLRAEDGKGSIGHAQFVIFPSDPRYRDIIKNLDGIRPGESKLYYGDE